ncbi:2-hydroxyacyl-CoA dehydratase subunit D [Homoserinimonas sp. A447]
MSKISAASAALGELVAAYADRAALSNGARPVIGYVGQDVPAELILAAGARPLRLRGNPEWNTDAADRYLGTGLDPATRSILAGILAGHFAGLRAIVVSSDCDASQRLFYVLREIQRVEPQTPLPAVYLLDILHLPRPTTTRYNIVRLNQCADALGEWTGCPVTDASLADAIKEVNETRDAQRAVMALRHAVPARLTGAEALAIIVAGTRLPAQRYRTLLQALVDGAETLPTHEGTRVFVSGSNHDSDAVYRAIEDGGAVIVSEDHDWGELTIGINVAGDSLDALARRYQSNGPTAQRASAQERAQYAVTATTRAVAGVLLSYSREKDEAPLWDFPAQAAALTIPALAAHRQMYGLIGSEAAAAALEPQTDKDLAS